MATVVTKPPPPTAVLTPPSAPGAAPRRAWASASTEVKALVALLCGSAARLLAALVLSVSHPTPVAACIAMIAVVAALAIATVVRGDRLPRGALLAQACVVCVIDGVLVSCAATTGGATADAFAYLWLTVYVGLFFPAACVPFGVLVSASFGAGLLAGDLSGLVAVWAVLTTSVLVAGTVVSQVGRAMQGRMSTDELTGVLNRRGLNETARRLRLRRRGDGRRVAVAAIDLDGFKEVNDLRGHACGDRLLADTAAAWRAVLRAGDVLARTGGDEFVLLMPSTEGEEATRVLARLHAAHPVPWSAGVADWHTDESLAACLERADRELYAAKRARAAAAAAAA